MPTQSKRCAIYTRKSSDEGLDQSFNSLDAQREACKAYVLSQACEGWKARPDRYDDGGFSGGNTDRPGLQSLLKDIEAGRVDIVVVYKIDRLTRSLADFARIVEIFEKHDCSFVSVTQSFNTTGSMGKLMLNVLLSFAQFEREVTGERIRDKIAASKAKGMWMGGIPPLGYDPPTDGSRTLKVNKNEAERVRHIFTRYLELGSVHVLQVSIATAQPASLSARLADDETILDRTGDMIMILLPIRFALRGSKQKIVPTTAQPPQPDQVLISALRKAHAMLRSERGMPGIDAAPGSPYDRNILRLAFLAPDIQRAILDGRQPLDLNLEALKKTAIPLGWSKQRKALGFGEPAAPCSGEQTP